MVCLSVYVLHVRLYVYYVFIAYIVVFLGKRSCACEDAIEKANASAIRKKFSVLFLNKSNFPVSIANIFTLHIQYFILFA